MFIGHHAVAFAAKPGAPRVSLGTLMAAAMLLDLIWPILTLAGIEHFRIAPGNTKVTPLEFYDYPYTHSLVAALAWSALAAIAYAAWRRARRDGLIVGVAVVSHWVLDYVTHRPDLPLWPNGPKVGLGLWNSAVGTIVVESLLFAIALVLYAGHTRARDRIGSIGFWLFVVLLVLIYIANFNSPPPPGTEAVSWMALGAWIFVPWAWWFDKHRDIRQL